MRKIQPLLFLLVFLFFTNSFVSAQPAPEDIPPGQGRKIVKAIEVDGNKTISLATILSKIKTRVGQEYLQSVISDDLKRLFNTGYFSDIRVDRQDFEGGFKVIIYLDEKPIVEEVTFSRTRFIKTKAIQKKIKTQAGKFLDNKSLNDDIKTIKELYSSKGLTSAEVDVESFIDEVTNKASLHFVIKEGYKVKIRKINVYGNDSFKDKKILKTIKTRRKTWFTSGFLKEDALAEDMERIKSFYEQQGYIDAVADYSIEYLVQGRVEVDIEIIEGKRYSIQTVEITGNEIISEKEIERVLKNIRVGNVFSRGKLSLDLSEIRKLYFDRGYIFSKVTESTSLDSETGRVDVTLDIDEGGIAYIEMVKVQGNTRTRDIVIRRELKLYPGDRFDGTKLRRSRERLENLGYFDEVGFNIEDTDVFDRKDLVVNVKEAKTGSFSFGGGFSTVDKLVGFIELQQRNFDFTNWPTFTGGGQQLTVRAETGSLRNNFLVSFTEPWIFDHPVSGGFDIFRSERNRDDDIGFAYDEEKTGGALRFGKRFSEYVSGGVKYKFERVTIGDFEPDVSADLKAEEGTNNVSVIGLTARRDSLNSFTNPSKGLVVSGGLDVAGGFLGGDKDFYRLQGNSSYYIPLSWNSVLEFRARAGIVNDFGDSQKVPIFERFFAGGANSIRGYGERGVGPIDSGTADPIGGESLFVANIEYTIPIVDFIKFATFFDTGNIWEKVGDFGSGGFKSGLGVGVRVKTPIGPIKLDYGYPLNEEPGEADKKGKFYFSVSRGF